jgi:hypothetical protein
MVCRCKEWRREWSKLMLSPMCEYLKGTLAHLYVIKRNTRYSVRKASCASIRPLPGN